MRKEQWTIKTLVEEAVNSDSPEATKERYGENMTWDISYTLQEGLLCQYCRAYYLFSMVMTFLTTILTLTRGANAQN